MLLLVWGRHVRVHANLGLALVCARTQPIQHRSAFDYEIKGRSSTPTCSATVRCQIFRRMPVIGTSPHSSKGVPWHAPNGANSQFAISWLCWMRSLLLAAF
jgi:hypothetical protein